MYDWDWLLLDLLPLLLCAQFVQAETKTRVYFVSTTHCELWIVADQAAFLNTSISLTKHVKYLASGVDKESSK